MQCTNEDGIKCQVQQKARKETRSLKTNLHGNLKYTWIKILYSQGRRRGWKDGRVHCVVNQYFATKFWGGPMLESQKLVGSGPVQPVRWLRLCIQLLKTISKKEENSKQIKTNQSQLCKKWLKSCPEISFFKSDDVDALIIVAGRDFQIGTTRDEKKYLRRLVRVRGMVSLNGWPRVLVLPECWKKLSYCSAIMKPTCELNHFG